MPMLRPTQGNPIFVIKWDRYQYDVIDYAGRDQSTPSFTMTTTEGNRFPLSRARFEGVCDMLKDTPREPLVDLEKLTPIFDWLEKNNHIVYTFESEESEGKLEMYKPGAAENSGKWYIASLGLTPHADRFFMREGFEKRPMTSDEFAELMEQAKVLPQAQCAKLREQAFPAGFVESLQENPLMPEKWTPQTIETFQTRFAGRIRSSRLNPRIK
ncbi:MAG: hypothetical protein LBU87_04720 [Lactobacillales bacterium]|jgi:hypothetical protein|nr:hypothetical protein [Lactobacillales bacterium]